MTQTLTIQMATEKVDPADFKKAGQDRENLLRISRHINALATGSKQGSIDVSSSSSGPVAASGTFVADTVIATDVVQIGTITLTGTDTPTTDLHFDTSTGTDIAIAAAIAASINANPTLSAIVLAASDGVDTVTVTAHQKGVIGNQIPISSVGSTITVSGAWLSGGTGGSQGAPVSISRT